MNQRKKYTDEEKLQIISEAKSSGNITATAKRYSVNDSSIHGWMKKLNKNEIIKNIPNEKLSSEIKKLKRQLADAQLENEVLKELVKKTVQVWTTSDQRLMNSSPDAIQKLRY